MQGKTHTRKSNDRHEEFAVFTVSSRTNQNMADTEEKLCTPQELEGILRHEGGGFIMLPGNDADLVFQGVYIGDREIAVNIPELKRLGITHVLNTAQGTTDYHINTDPGVYKNSRIHYMSIEATDHMNFDLRPFFEKTSDFIESAVKNGGQVLVHCIEGVSRSSTIVLAYLMQRHHLTAQDAIRLVRKSREICPNDGFLQQLCDFNQELQEKGHFKNNDNK